jgi:hypothetical protein
VVVEFSAVVVFDPELSCDGEAGSEVEVGAFVEAESETDVERDGRDLADSISIDCAAVVVHAEAIALVAGGNREPNGSIRSPEQDRIAALAPTAFGLKLQ